MSTIAEIKSMLHQYIVETNDVDTLNDLRNYFETQVHQPDQAVAYTIEGEALSRKAYQQDIDDAIDQADRDEVVSQKTIEQAQP